MTWHIVVDKRLENGKRVVTCSCGMRCWPYGDKLADEIWFEHAARRVAS